MAQNNKFKKGDKVKIFTGTAIPEAYLFTILSVSDTEYKLLRDGSDCPIEHGISWLDNNAILCEDK